MKSLWFGILVAFVVASLIAFIVWFYSVKIQKKNTHKDDSQDPHDLGK